MKSGGASYREVALMKKRKSMSEDESMDFPCNRINAKPSEARRIVSDYALSWILYQKGCGEKGCVIFDIDDTLIDGSERVVNGFEFLADTYMRVHKLYPVHIVTARPAEDHSKCMEMLGKRGIVVDPDRLHMIPSEDWGDDKKTEEFKWNCHMKCFRLHDGVIAKFGDKLWDVAHIQALHSYMSHVEDEWCLVFFDPYLKGTLSCKLPGK